jgi:hypothetical protein
MLSEVCVWDPGSEIWDSDRIPDPQHWIEATGQLDGR